MSTRRRLVLAAAAATALPGCAGLPETGKLILSEREIGRLVERNFPLERRLLEVFDVILSTPRVRLLPERNRLAAALDMAARERLFNGAWQGRLEFDAALRWQAGDRSIRLSQVRVHDFALESVATASGNPMRSGAERLGGALIERMLEAMAVYTLSAERAEQLRQAGYGSGTVAVTSRGVEITFERPAR